MPAHAKQQGPISKSEDNAITMLNTLETTGLLYEVRLIHSFYLLTLTFIVQKNVYVVIVLIIDRTEFIFALSVEISILGVPISHQTCVLGQHIGTINYFESL